ncbi:MAG: sodium-dependent transporter, partial [Clostridium sp.]
ITGSTTQIERANRVMMPIFFILFAILAIRVFFLPGAMEGYKFLFVPKWNQLGNLNTWVMAMGQAFFSLSITGSGMIVYGSYLNRNADIVGASLRTAFFDTIAALLAALAIMPAVFAFGIEPGAGPSLMFITIPKIFAQMPMGRLFAVIFFLSVVFAGITSLINMFEAVIESIQHRFDVPRKPAVLLCGAICFLVGVFIEAEPNVGSWMDFITILVVPFGAVLGAISIYYVLGYREIKKEMEMGRKKPLPAWFGVVAKYVYVPLTVIVFVLGIIYKGIG